MKKIIVTVLFLVVVLASVLAYDTCYVSGTKDEWGDLIPGTRYVYLRAWANQSGTNSGSNAYIKIYKDDIVFSLGGFSLFLSKFVVVGLSCYDREYKTKDTTVDEVVASNSTFIKYVMNPNVKEVKIRFTTYGFEDVYGLKIDGYLLDELRQALRQVL